VSALRDKRSELRFEIDSADGWVRDVRRVHSPNFDARPVGSTLDLIVIHGISLPPGEFGGDWIDQLFTNCLDGNEHPYFTEIRDLRVSSHLLIRRDGSLTQYVPFGARAWHAGESCYCGREVCNDFSIGIELEGADDKPYEDSQYSVLASLVAALRRAYPSLVDAELVGHCDIAPGRKTDPGSCFDWKQLSAELISIES